MRSEHPKTSIVLDRVCVHFPVPTPHARSGVLSTLARAPGIGAKISNSATSIATVCAIDNISLKLAAGDRVGLIGSNGAGKSTLIRMLAGIYTPTSGSLAVEGRRVPMFDINIGFDEEATGYENIHLRGLMLGMTPAEIKLCTCDVEQFSNLGPFLELPLRTYSAGMRLRLMFSIATSIKGNIVLMDEWISAGDSAFRKRARTRLAEVIGESGIFILASHNSDRLREHCTKGLHLSSGKIKAFGPIDDVLNAAGQ